MNIEDRRGMNPVGKIGIGGGLVTVIVIVIALLMGGDPQAILDQVQQGGQTTSSQGAYQPTEHEEELADFVSVVLADTEDVWSRLFAQMGMEYREPTLILFSGAAESACGYAASATGPFYCARDEKVYIDLNYLEEIQRKLNAPGDFAIAYIVAHEVGHHVQNLLGTLGEINELRSRSGENEANRLTVKLELQADFYAGVWAYHVQEMKDVLEDGDIEEAINASQAVGDDRIQMQTQGYVVPDSFTHGTSEQRMKAFMKGFKSGDITQRNI
jgi:predicted metalloprotease